MVRHIHDRASGAVRELQATGWGATVMDEHYGYDKHGNRVSRQSGGFYAATEHYSYDADNRLIGARVKHGSHSTTTLTASYDDAGNFQSRSDRGGSLSYGYQSGQGADRLASVSGHLSGSFACDAAGRITSGPDGLSADYNARGLATVLHKRGHTAELTYAPDGHRYKSVLDGTKSEYYMAGGAFRIVQKNGVTTYREAVVVGGVTIAQLTTRSNASDEFHYFFHDALGSIVAVTGTDGAAHIQHLAYGPYGEMRKGKDWTTLMTPPAIHSLNLPTRRGYTGGEALTALGLVHLGARIYDPALGRFLSPDPAGASVPYVYVGDNPMSDTDPSGEISVGQVLTIAALVVLSVVTYGALSGVLVGYLAGMATGAIMGFASGMIASNGNLHAGLMGALAGAASGAAFGYLGGLNYSGGMFEKAAVEGFAGGALSDVEGGSFKDGFVGAFVGSVSEGLTRRIPGNDDLANTEKVAAAAALGGTASELTGGSFANGAISAAFQHLFNDVAHDSKVRFKYKSKGLGKFAEADKKYKVSKMFESKLPSGHHTINVSINRHLKSNTLFHMENPSTIEVNPTLLAKAPLNIVASSIGHELIHENDYLRGLITNSYQRASSETRAYNWQLDTASKFGLSAGYRLQLSNHLVKWEKAKFRLGKGD